MLGSRRMAGAGQGHELPQVEAQERTPRGSQQPPATESVSGEFHDKLLGRGWFFSVGLPVIRTRNAGNSDKKRGQSPRNQGR